MSSQVPNHTQFIASRKQLQRMAVIVAMLKKKDWVKMKKIQDKLDATEFERGAYLGGCVNRTIQRDIKILREEYGAKITYDRSEAAYHLEDQEWTFQIPALLNREQLLAAVVGGRICQDIFPAEISDRVNSAVEEIIRVNESTGLSDGLLDSLKVLTVSSGSGDVFQLVFDAWRKRHRLRITYLDRNGISTIRDIDPHVLVFFDMMWCVKGYCHLRDEVRTFHLSQIKAAVDLEIPFTPNPEIIASVTPDSFLDYKPVEDVRIHLNEAGRMYAFAHALHSEQDFVKDEDGSYHMYVPKVPLERLVPWILNQQGNATPESPPKAVEAVRAAIRRLADACQAYDPEEIRWKNRKSVTKKQL